MFVKLEYNESGILKDTTRDWMKEEDELYTFMNTVEKICFEERKQEMVIVVN